MNASKTVFCKYDFYFELGNVDQINDKIYFA